MTVRANGHLFDDNAPLAARRYPLVHIQVTALGRGVDAGRRYGRWMPISTPLAPMVFLRPPVPFRVRHASRQCDARHIATQFLARMFSSPQDVPNVMTRHSVMQTVIGIPWLSTYGPSTRWRRMSWAMDLSAGKKNAAFQSAAHEYTGNEMRNVERESSRMSQIEDNTADVDCDAGRRQGCGTFCCRLLVRLKPHEIEPDRDGVPGKRFVDKDEDGYCAHFEKTSSLCSIWDRRPATCRDYSCNNDFLLQVAVREGFADIADLVRKAATTYIPAEQYVQVPRREP